MRTQSHRTLVVERLEQRQLLAVSDVVITEIMYHPLDTDAERVAGVKDRDLEFIEIMNLGSTPAQLAGASFRDAVDFSFGSLVIEAGAHAVVVHNRPAFEARYGTQLLIAGEYDGTLGNGGDHVVFQDATGTVIQDINYEDKWYPLTDGEGYSLTAVEPTNRQLDRDLRTSWSVSQEIDGSPGHPDGDLDPRPRNLTSSPQSSRHLQLSWNQPQHPRLDPPDYRVYRDNVLIGRTAATSLVDVGVEPEGRYVYQVAAVHSGGREFFSPPHIAKVEAVGGDLMFAPGANMGTLRVDGVNELSGMTGSRQNKDVFWTHNDGPQSVVYGINSRGAHVATLRLSGVRSLDWEDIAVGPGPTENVDYLYLGDIGGKDPKRNEVRVHRIVEPKVSADQTQINVKTVEAITLRYPNGAQFNAETLMSDPQTGDLYVIPKLGSGTPVFRAAASRLTGGATIWLELVAEIGFPNVSGGDISPSGNEIVIRSEDRAQLFPRADGQSVADAFMFGDGQLIPVVGRPTEPNGEAITFDSAGRNYFTISEGEAPELYSFQRVPTAFAGDANRDQLFNSSDLVQVFQAGRYETGVPALFSQGDWNGDGYFDSGDLVVAFRLGHYEQPAAALFRVSVDETRIVLDTGYQNDESGEVAVDTVFADTLAHPKLGAICDDDFKRSFVRSLGLTL